MDLNNSNLNILIVDDTAEHIHIAASILKPLGYPIRAALNGRSALKLIEKQLPSLILLDLSMPEMDGFEICRILKSHEIYKDIAIIFITASEDEESITKGFKLGGQDYVIKPYNASELLARVTTHLKLIQQKNELKYAYNELDKFCHTVSHDLKSPLLVISQLTDILDAKLCNKKTDEIKFLLSQISLKSHDTILMIERLLKLYEINQYKCTFTPVDLKTTAENVYNELHSLNPEQEVIFKCGSLPVVSGDKTLIYLLFQNSISNALKFSRNSKPSIINICCREEDNYYNIYVKDNGAGFNMKYSAKLFHVFERLHNKEDFEGSGVGLSIIKKIMEHHSGTVSIYSEPGKGTCLTFKFPVF